MKLISIYKAKRLTPVGALAVGALLTLGCGRIVVEHADTGPTAPPYQGEVAVIMEGGEQPVGMRELAIVQVTATGSKAKLPTAIDALKARARSLGCNTVAKVSVDRSNAMVVTGVCGLVE